MAGPLQKSKKIAKVQSGGKKKKMNEKASININGNKEEKRKVPGTKKK